MDNKSRNQYKPQIVSPPGATIADLLYEKNLTQREFAERMGCSLNKARNIINGKQAITHEIAITLEEIFGIPATFWNEREARYRKSILDAR